MTGLLGQTRPWESTVGDGPILRGRRADGGGPSIHFLPGNGFCGGVYWPFLRQFLPEFGLFLHDIEGHGASDPPERFSGIPALARRVPQVMREQGLGDGLIGMGHSWGAALTLMVSADNPGLFRALVLLDPITMPPAVWAVARGLARLGLHPMANAARRRRNHWDSREAAREALRGRGIFRGWPDEALEGFIEHALRDEGGEVELACPRELEAAIFEHPIYCWKAFKNNSVPTLFLYGSSSYGFFPLAAKLAGRGHRAFRSATVPGHHCFMLEHPHAAADIVRPFLRSVG